MFPVVGRAWRGELRDQDRRVLACPSRRLPMSKQIVAQFEAKSKEEERQQQANMAKALRILIDGGSVVEFTAVSSLDNSR